MNKILKIARVFERVFDIKNDYKTVNSRRDINAFLPKRFHVEYFFHAYCI